MAVGSRGRPLAYEVRPYEHHKSAAVLHCAQCGKAGVVPISGGSHNPTFIGQRLVREGWKININVPRKCICPECVEAKREHHDMPNDNVLPLPTANPVQPEPAPSIALNVQPRAATREERSAIRAKLDDVFDDTKGAYAEGWSDKAVGSKLGIPWKIVETIREAAYGSILVDTEADALQADLKKLKDRLSSIETSVLSAMENIESLSKAISNTEGRVATLALNRKKGA